MDFNTETITKVLSAIIYIISVVLFDKTKYKINIFSRKVTNITLKESLRLFKHYKNTNNEKMITFTEKSIEEYHFYKITGIRTNSDSIIKYSNFKDKLGENYTWKDIRMIKEYLVFNDNEIEIKVSKLTFRSASILYFLLLILPILFTITIIQDVIPKMGIDMKSIIPFFLILCFFILIGGFIIKVVIPPIYANGIRKKLEKRENTKDKNKPTSKSNT